MQTEMSASNLLQKMMQFFLQIGIVALLKNYILSITRNLSQMIHKCLIQPNCLQVFFTSSLPASKGFPVATIIALKEKLMQA